MLAHSNPETLDTVAGRWAAIDLALQQAQEDLLHHTRAATAHWAGTAADAFTARAAELHQAIGNGAAYASHASSGVTYAADALRQARLDMPPEPASLEGVVTSEQARTTGTADALHEQQRQQAVAVMERLEQRYAAAAEMIGNPASLDQSHDRGVFAPQTAASTVHIEPAAGVTGDPRLATPHATSPHPGAGSSETPTETAPTSDPLRSAVPATRIPGPTEGSGHATLQGSSGTGGFMTSGTDSPSERAATLGPPETPTEGIQIANVAPAPSGVQAELSVPRQTRGFPTATSINTGRSAYKRIPNSLNSATEATCPTPPTRPEVTGGIAQNFPADPEATQLLDSGPPGTFGSSLPAGWSGEQRMPGRRNQRRSRPEYLKEDSYTWLTDQIANPPVIT
ncbi:hypothetical protein [Streptacidiphilus melanogenes]|uniref:hypothetical protein n=1 Tax=Streptacidiphilus melanogenes TaxID=411235 RepID=UPI0012699A9E|nr:hypothetical protein [Streptacidiphilus melanogenes]